MASNASAQIHCLTQRKKTFHQEIAAMNNRKINYLNVALILRLNSLQDPQPILPVISATY